MGDEEHSSEGDLGWRMCLDAVAALTWNDPAVGNGSVLIRSARSGDETALARVHRLAAPDAYRWVSPERWRDADWATRVAAGGVIVAEEDRIVVGFAVLARRELRSLYVEPSSQGQGLGRALLRASESRLAPGTATLWVIERNNPACAFYERAGWTHDGVRRDDVWGPELRYRKLLPP